MSYDLTTILLTSNIFNLYKAEIFFLKAWDVGTLNLCLKVPEKLQKTRDKCNHFRLKKQPITVKKKTKNIRICLILTVFGCFLGMG